MSRKYELNGRTIMDVKVTEAKINAPIAADRLTIPAAFKSGAAKPARGPAPYQWVIRRQFIGTYLDSDSPSYDTKASTGLRLEDLVVTHHMDHAGDVRAFAAQGATIVVGQGSGEHFRRVLAASFKRNPDLGSRDLTGTAVAEVGDKRIFSDGIREVGAYLIDNPHAIGFLI